MPRRHPGVPTATSLCIWSPANVSATCLCRVAPARGNRLRFTHTTATENHALHKSYIFPAFAAHMRTSLAPDRTGLPRVCWALPGWRRGTRQVDGCLPITPHWATWTPVHRGSCTPTLRLLPQHSARTDGDTFVVGHALLSRAPLRIVTAPRFTPRGTQPLRTDIPTRDTLSAFTAFRMCDQCNTVRATFVNLFLFF